MFANLTIKKCFMKNETSFMMNNWIIHFTKKGRQYFSSRSQPTLFFFCFSPLFKKNPVQSFPKHQEKLDLHLWKKIISETARCEMSTSCSINWFKIAQSLLWLKKAVLPFLLFWMFSFVFLSLDSWLQHVGHQNPRCILLFLIFVVSILLNSSTKFFLLH